MSRWLILIVTLALVAGCNQKTDTARQGNGGEGSPSSASAPSSDGATDRTVSRPAAPSTDEPAAPAGPASDTAASGDSERAIQLDRLLLTAPEGWVRKPAASSFVLAEFTVPKAEGDSEDGRLTVSVAGGSIEQNVDRWRGQFGGQPEKESQEKVDVGGLEVVVVDLSGEFNDARGPFAPAVQKPGFRMLAAIIPVDGQLHFLKLTAPQKTAEAHYDAFQSLVKSARKP